MAWALGGFALKSTRRAWIAFFSFSSRLAVSCQ
jgi:hypothetical protein